MTISELARKAEKMLIALPACHDFWACVHWDTIPRNPTGQGQQTLLPPKADIAGEICSKMPKGPRRKAQGSARA